MAFQAVPNTAEIDMIFTLNGATVQNVFYALFSGTYILADLQALADQTDINWDGNWKTEQPPEVVYQRTEVRGLSVENDLIATANAFTGPGTNASEPLPNNVSFAIKKESGLTGRSARGRCFWIGVPQNQLEIGDENILQAAFVALLVANVETVRTGTDAVAGWSAALVSRFNAGSKRTTGITFPWVSSVAVDNRVDTQRGRLPSM